MLKGKTAVALGLLLGLAVRADEDYERQFVRPQPGREGKFVFQNTTGITQTVDYEMVWDPPPGKEQRRYVYRVIVPPHGTVSSNGGDWGPVVGYGGFRAGSPDGYVVYFYQAAVLGWTPTVWTRAEDMTDEFGNRLGHPLYQPWHFLITEQTKDKDYRVKTFTLELGRRLRLGIP